MKYFSIVAQVLKSPIEPNRINLIHEKIILICIHVFLPQWYVLYEYTT